MKKVIGDNLVCYYCGKKAKQLFLMDWFYTEHVIATYGHKKCLKKMFNIS